MKKYIPSEGSPTSKIWIVGEAPGWWEEQDGKPFVGDSGRLLDDALTRNGIFRADCFVTNLCHYRPRDNKFENLLLNDDASTPCPELAEGLQELYALLEQYTPNLIIALGAWPCWYLTEKDGISKYRGSILSYIHRPIKVIPTFHPSYILRNPSELAIFDIDFVRMARDAEFPELRIPERFYHTNYNEHFEKLKEAKVIAVDIESRKDSTTLLCVGFAYDRYNAVVVPYSDNDFAAHDFISSVFSLADCEFVYHNGIFDTAVLRENGFKPPHHHDTHIQALVLNPEMPRSLDHLTSILTRQPYYKDDGKSGYTADAKTWNAKAIREELYAYNGKDCCVTFEIFEEQAKELEELGLTDYYRYKMEAVEVSKHFTSNGIWRDPVRHKLISDQITRDINSTLGILFYLNGNKPFNPSSPKQVAGLLYDTLKLPERKNKGSVTTDDDALVSLIAYTKGRVEELKTPKAKEEWQRKFFLLQQLKKYRGLEKLRSSYYDIQPSPDGRIRSLYKPGATETSRWAASTYVDGTGLNSQTLPRDSIEVTE